MWWFDKFIVQTSVSHYNDLFLATDWEESDKLDDDLMSETNDNMTLSVLLLSTFPATISNVKKH